MEEGYEYLMQVEYYRESDTWADYVTLGPDPYKLYGKAFGNITIFKMLDANDGTWFDITVFPTKVITTYDYDTQKRYDVKVNASFKRGKRNICFYLPYLK